MGRLEEKLIELGYRLDHEINLLFQPKETWFAKKYDEVEDIIIIIYLEDGIIDKDFCQVEINDKYKYGFSSQSVIDSLYAKLTQAFNQLQHDLEVLREYEEKN